MGKSDRRTVLRLLSYNIHGCIGSDRKADSRRTAGIIAEINADLVALQEVDLEGTTAAGRSQAATIGEGLKMENIYFPVEKTGRHRYGLAVLSRLPFVNVHFLRLPNLYPRLNPRKRDAILAALDTHSGPVLLINTHLSVFKMERHKQLGALLTAFSPDMATRDQPLILCGDLNAGPSSSTYRTLSKHMRDTQQASSETGLQKGTFHARSPAFRIDHIFVSQHFTLLGAGVRKTPATATASDHLPLFADVSLRIPSRRSRA